MNSKPHIYFTTSGLFTFVKKDLNFLEKHYHVNVFVFHATQKWKVPFLFLSQLFSIIAQVFKTDIYICKFPGYLSIIPCLIAKLTNKPCLLITAGTESAGIPSIHYGNFDKKILGKFTEWSFRLAKHIAPVHRSLMLQDYVYHSEIFKQQGASFFCKNLKTPFTEIHYGFNPEQWALGKQVRKTNSVAIIAAGFESPVVFMRKGLDLIFEVAPLVPDFNFTIIGCEESAMSMKTPANVTLVEKIPQTELISLFQQHEFYAQLSMFEGFPNALCEAMLCGCIPIGSSVSAIPDIISHTGFVLQHKNVNDLVALLQQAKQCDKQALSINARQRVIDNYHYTIREEKLKKLIDELIKK